MSHPATGMNLAFNGTFAAMPSLQTTAQHGTYKTCYYFGGRFLNNPGENQCYVDPDYKGLGLQPFSVSGSILTISANPSGSYQSQLSGKPYMSGLLTTETTFAQQYGYFEARMKLPPGKGLWPAFWLLPSDKAWPPEIDVVEGASQFPTKLYTNAIPGGGVPASFDEHDCGFDLSADFHTYGLMWTAEALTFYLDDIEIRSIPTPSSMHRPMYMLVNLAVGGPSGWIDQPDESTPFPAELKVEFIKAWSTEVVDANLPVVTFSYNNNPFDLSESRSVFPKKGTAQILRASDFNIYGSDPDAVVMVGRSIEGRLYVTAMNAWNEIKNVRIRTPGKVDAHVYNFVDVTAMGPGNGGRLVAEWYKRGSIDMGPTAVCRVFARGFDSGDNLTEVELHGSGNRLEIVGNSVTEYTATVDGNDDVIVDGGKVRIERR